MRTTHARVPHVRVQNHTPLYIALAIAIGVHLAITSGVFFHTPEQKAKPEPIAITLNILKDQPEVSIPTNVIPTEAKTKPAPYMEIKAFTLTTGLDTESLKQKLFTELLVEETVLNLTLNQQVMQALFADQTTADIHCVITAQNKLLSQCQDKFQQLGIASVGLTNEFAMLQPPSDRIEHQTDQMAANTLERYGQTPVAHWINVNL